MFLDVSSNLENFWKKSLNGHATVVGSQATVSRLSNDVFGRFKQFGEFLKKVTERSRDHGRRSRDRRPTVKHRFWTFQAIRKNCEKSRWLVTRQWSEVTRTLADCQTKFFERFKQLGKFLKKSHWTVTRQWSEVTWPLIDCRAALVLLPNWLNTAPAYARNKVA